MMRSGWSLLLALLVNGLVAAAPSPLHAADSKVIDKAEFFSKSAREQATKNLQTIKGRFKVEVVIETFAAIPDNLKAKYQSAEKSEFFRRWGQTRATDEGIKGIYVLICKNPGRLQIAVDRAVREKAFTLEDRDALVASAVKLMGRKQYDAALSEIVDTIESALVFNP